MFAGHRNQIPRWRMAGLGKPPLSVYIQKVLGIQPTSLIGYWPFIETSGTNADNAEGTAARDGTYTGVTLNGLLGPDNINGAPLFDGISDFVNCFTPSLATAFGGAGQWTVASWIRTAAWADGSFRSAFMIQVGAGNRFLFQRRNASPPSTNIQYTAGGVAKTIQITQTTLDWFHLTMTVDQAADEYKAYIDGVQVGATENGLGVWAGQITLAMFGAQNAVPAQPWDSSVAHPAIWTTVLGQSDITKLATV